MALATPFPYAGQPLNSCDMTILHFFEAAPMRASGVLEQTLLLIRLQHAEEIAGLRVVVMVILAEIELRGITVDGQWRLRKLGCSCHSRVGSAHSWLVPPLLPSTRMAPSGGSCGTGTSAH